MEKNQLKRLVGISAIPEIGPVSFKKIINHFQPLESFFSASCGEIMAAGIRQKAAEQIISSREKVDIAVRMAELEREGIEVIYFEDNIYPPLLQEIYDFPPLLYLRGSPAVLNHQPLISVVGSRQPTLYGQAAARNLTKGLVEAGAAIVSGLARGIDSLAHQAAVESGGLTIAVLGNGLDWLSLYPRENKSLAEAIIRSGGAVISEFPCGTKPLKQNFPLRNRLLSGLSFGTLVVEAGAKSGALITAKSALDQNREVFAVPGNIDSEMSVGPNNLIKAGAKAVTSVNDILEVLNLTLVKENVILPKAREIKADSPEEERLLPFLSSQAVPVDWLISQSGLGSEAVNSTLMMMEISGKIRDVGGRRYILN